MSENANIPDDILQFTVVEDGQSDQPDRFDFTTGEDVLIEIVGPHDDNPDNLDWHNWSIESCTVIKCQDGVMGAAQYDHHYGAGLEYTLQGAISNPGAGWWVIPDIKCTFIRGDGWTTDDDVDFEMGELRPASDDERKLA